MFSEQFSSYLRYEKRYSEHTVTAYLKDLEQFGDFLELNGLDYTSARYQDVRGWIVKLLEQADARTINRKISTLRSFYKFLVREKLADQNPVLRVRALKVSKRLPAVVPEKALNVMLDGDGVFEEGFTGLRDRLVLEMLFGTGIRLAELLHIKESDIDLYQQSVRIFGKRRKERIVPLNASLMRLTGQYIKEKKAQNFQNDSLALVVTGEGKPAYPRLIYRIVKKYLSYITTGEKRSPHVLRHSFATSLLNNGADLNAIKELLGHASLAATQVYTHNSVERLKTIYKQAHPKA